jgi:hypothetical protein
VARQLRTVATMVVLVGILVAAAYVGWVGLTQGWLGDSGQPTANGVPEESCSAPPPRTLRTDRVRVSVYNAGAPSGQATALMGALSSQGFLEGELGDAPDPVDVEGIVVWPGTAGRARVRLVVHQFETARVAQRHSSLGPGVTVLIGEEFEGLADDAPRLVDVARPEVCGPVS